MTTSSDSVRAARVGKVLTPMEDYSFSKVFSPLSTSTSAAGNGTTRRMGGGVLPSMTKSPRPGLGLGQDAGMFSAEELVNLHGLLSESLSVMAIVSVVEKIEVAAMALTGATQCRFYLLEVSKAGAKLKTHTKHGEPTYYSLAGFTAAAIKSKEPVVANSLNGDEHFSSSVDGFGMDAAKARNVLACPVFNFFSGRLMGCITVFFFCHQSHVSKCSSPFFPSALGCGQERARSVQRGGCCLVAVGGTASSGVCRDGPAFRGCH